MGSDEFRFPAPYYSGLNLPRQNNPHSMTSEGMLMPSYLQSPPMYGPRGATLPPKYLEGYGRTNCQPYKSSFYCETCDRSFKSQNDLDDHKSEHQRCGIDGCSFVAHPFVVTKHIEQQHSSGLYDKLKDLKTPEDIAKWREERKKRYPSRANIELRQQIQAEKMKRGERLEEKKGRFGQREDRRQNQNHNRTERPPRNERNQRKRKRKQEDSTKPVVEIVEEDKNSTSKIKKFEGTSSLTSYSRPETTTTVMKNALESLAGMYGSDEDSESDEEIGRVQDAANEECSSAIDESKSEGNEDQPIGEKDLTESNPLTDDGAEKIVANNEETNQICSQEEFHVTQSACLEPSDNEDVLEDSAMPDVASDNEDIEDVPFEKVIENFPEVEEQSASQEPNPEGSKRIRVRRRPDKSSTKKPKPTSGLNYTKLFRRRQNTMLEKLLQPDIIHERNVLLQCVRYVVQKNFFGIGQQKPAN